MKDCKCGRIPRCYSGKKFRIHEELEKIKAGDETHDKVYELNRQMCDIDKHLSEAGYFRMVCDGQIEARKKLINMEEKKLNPMTKAEAFEYLKGKKVYANGKGKEVQMKLFECGVGWATNHFVYYDFGDYLLIETDGRLYHCGHEGDSYWRAHHFKEISADDILSIEIVDDKKIKEERKGEILNEITKLGERISDLIEEYGGDVVIEIDQYEVLLRDSGDILYRK